MPVEPNAEQQDQIATAIIERCRKVNRYAGAEYVKRGVQPIDVALAAAFSAHDLAISAGHTPLGAIEWLRTVLDLQERQLLDAHCAA